MSSGEYIMATNHYIIRYMLMMSMAGVFLFACSKSTPSPSQMDKSPFTGIPCAAPCWHGLLVGKSSENDVMSTLPTLTFIDQNTIQVFKGSRPTLNYETFAPGVEIDASCIQPSQQCLQLTVAADILTSIVVKLNYEIKVDEAIRYLGNPDYIGYLDLGAEKIMCETYLIWSSKQLVLASETFEGPKAVEANCGMVRDTSEIAPGLLISEVRYVSSSTIEAMLSTHSGKFFEFSGTLPEK